MKKFFFVISSAFLLVACGGSSDTKSAKTDSSSNAANSTGVSSADEKGLELIGSSDCTTCHRLNKTSPGVATGPDYADVAAKYAPAADTTIDRLVSKIMKGGGGVWGPAFMTPHPMLKETDVRIMVKYILSLKK
ncbi:MAG TPA: c-type cytochrome [Puia sp.]|nr:c-type cytochrome [Puia sp.]